MKAVILVVAVLAGSAAAETKVMILQSEGRTDATTRKKVDAALIKLAKTTPDTIVPGEITYSDATAMVGCKPNEASCNDEVLATLAVDEIVFAQVNPKPGGIEVAVKRVGKSGASKDATTVVTADKLDNLDAIATVFGKQAPAPVGPTQPTKPVGPTQPTNPPTNPTVIGPTQPTNPETPPVEPKVVEPVKPVDTKPETKPLPSGPIDQPEEHWYNRRKVVLGGMAGGGGMVLLGIILWGTAASDQSDIDSFKVRSRDDLQRLKDLESSADAKAGWGNFFFLGGLAVAGVSTYFYIKQRRAHQTTTAVVPTLFDHGAGITFSFGGGR
jgi:hypothetical protein